MSAIRFVLGLVLALTIFPTQVLAVSISFTNAPSSIDQSNELQVQINLVCDGCTSDSYLRGVFYPSGTNYFGYTKNNDGSWINASGEHCIQYLKIASNDFVEGSWSGTLMAKVDTENVAYAGPGNYYFKVGRYTGSCSATWSSEIPIVIAGPTLTPTPSPTVTIAPTSKPTPTPTRLPTSVIAPSVQNTSIPTKTPTLKLSPSSTISPALDILGMSTGAATSTIASHVVSDELEASTNAGSATPNTRPLIIALLAIATGLGLLTGVFVWQKKDLWKKSIESQHQ